MRRLITFAAIAGIFLIVGMVTAMATGHDMLAISALALLGAVVAAIVGLVAAVDPEGRGAVVSRMCMLGALGLILLSCGTAFAADGGLAVPAVVMDYGAFYGAGLVGMVAHYMSKWFRGEITDSLMGYFFKVYNRRTVATLISLAVAEATAFATSTLDVASLQTILSVGFLAGYSLDSAVNKGNTPA